MNRLVEVPTVKETEHLVPNLHVFVKALFGEKAFLVDWRHSHGDWATMKLKYGDGLVWCPWLGQLWVIELEWKEGSNFFDQSRAFAKGKIDVDKLSNALRKCFQEFEPALNQASPGMEKGFVVNNLVSNTLKRHVKDNYLKSHGWVILGHAGDNIDKLRRQYQDELKARFTGKQQYILSMARLFQSDLSAFFLLEQHCSEKCTDYVAVDRCMLVPAIMTEKKSPPPINHIPDEDNDEVVPVGMSRTALMLAYLKELNPGVKRENIALLIEIDDKHKHVFKVDWRHTGKEFLVFGKSSWLHRKPSNAAKEVFGEQIVSTYGNIARKRGTFVDVSKSPAEIIAKYVDVEKHVRQLKKIGTIATPAEKDLFVTLKARTYFDSLTPHKQKKIYDNIIKRKELWNVFLEKRKMTSAEFKTFSQFKSKGIAGFMRFLTENEIAKRFGDMFTLNDAVIPHIEELLKRTDK